MIAPAYRFTVFALYQITVALGIVLLPLALVVRQAGVTLPVGRLIGAAERAYENASME